MKKVENKLFIEAWQKSDTVQQVCDITKLTRGSAYSKAFRLRQLGVELKKMTGKVEREKPELIKLAKKLNPVNRLRREHFSDKYID